LVSSCSASLFSATELSALSPLSDHFRESSDKLSAHSLRSLQRSHRRKILLQTLMMLTRGCQPNMGLV
ncbi:MAG: hypothetical protein ACXWC9_00430, partial [Pseudobdellovibrionaceae bacterium]